MTSSYEVPKEFKPLERSDSECFERCPVCASVFRVELRYDWQEQVEKGAVIGIVGCGNPWHYEGVEQLSS